MSDVCRVGQEIFERLEPALVREPDIDVDDVGTHLLGAGHDRIALHRGRDVIEVEFELEPVELRDSWVVRDEQDVQRLFDGWVGSALRLYGSCGSQDRIPLSSRG